MLENYVLSVTNVPLTCVEGTEFDVVEHDGKIFWINLCRPTYQRSLAG